ncbi:hypothetical protein B0H13DRAFT_2269716 [Mycena leptocephala]|nr:hypothetical protein B0H13DRAFT_2269716 [Mycena leptocephala]
MVSQRGLEDGEAWAGGARSLLPHIRRRRAKEKQKESTVDESLWRYDTEVGYWIRRSSKKGWVAVSHHTINRSGAAPDRDRDRYGEGTGATQGVCGRRSGCVRYQARDRDRDPGRADMRKSTGTHARPGDRWLEYPLAGLVRTGSGLERRRLRALDGAEHEQEARKRAMSAERWQIGDRGLRRSRTRRVGPRTRRVRLNWRGSGSNEKQTPSPWSRDEAVKQGDSVGVCAFGAC